MPVRYICRHCGTVLWEFKHVGQDYYGLPTPTEVMNVYGGICPNCKRELRKPDLEDIRINWGGTSGPSIGLGDNTFTIHGGRIGSAIAET